MCTNGIFTIQCKLMQLWSGILITVSMINRSIIFSLLMQHTDPTVWLIRSRVKVVWDLHILTLFIEINY